MTPGLTNLDWWHQILFWLSPLKPLWWTGHTVDSMWCTMCSCARDQDDKGWQEPTSDGQLVCPGLYLTIPLHLHHKGCKWASPAAKALLCDLPEDPGSSCAAPDSAPFLPWRLPLSGLLMDSSRRFFCVMLWYPVLIFMCCLMLLCCIICLCRCSSCLCQDGVRFCVL